MGLIHGKQLRNNSVGFSKLLPDENLDLAGYGLKSVKDGILDGDGVNKLQMEVTILSAITSNNTELIAGNGLIGGGYTSATTVTFNANVDNQGIYIINDIIKLGDTNNHINGDYTFNNNLHIGGNAIIDGNVTILGTATTINTDDLYVKDNRIVVNSTAISGNAIPRYSGLDIFRGNGYTNSSGILWDNNNNTWVIQSPWVNSNIGSGTTNNNAILTTKSLINGDAINTNLESTNDGIDNTLKVNVKYDGSSIKLNGSNELYTDFGSTTADTYVDSGQLTGTSTLVLHRNDNTNISVDLSSLDTVDSFLTGVTLTPGSLSFKGNENFNSFDISDLKTVINTSPTISASSQSIILGGTIGFDVKDNSINTTHIDFGSNTNQVDADSIPIDNISGMSATTIQNAIEELKNGSELKAVPTLNDKDITPDNLTTPGNIQFNSSDLTLTETPAENSQAILSINGVNYIIHPSGTTKDVRFNGTSIYFNTSNLFNIDTDDRIDLLYDVLR